MQGVGRATDGTIGGWVLSHGCSTSCLTEDPPEAARVVPGEDGLWDSFRASSSTVRLIGVRFSTIEPATGVIPMTRMSHK